VGNSWKLVNNSSAERQELLLENSSKKRAHISQITFLFQKNTPTFSSISISATDEKSFENFVLPLIYKIGIKKTERDPIDKNYFRIFIDRLTTKEISCLLDNLVSLHALPFSLSKQIKCLFGLNPPRPSLFWMLAEYVQTHKEQFPDEVTSALPLDLKDIIYGSPPTDVDQKPTIVITQQYF